jgi:hypothetical protein
MATPTHYINLQVFREFMWKPCPPSYTGKTQKPCVARRGFTVLEVFGAQSWHTAVFPGRKYNSRRVSPNYGGAMIRVHRNERSMQPTLSALQRYPSPSAVATTAGTRSYPAHCQHVGRVEVLVHLFPVRSPPINRDIGCHALSH